MLNLMNATLGPYEVKQQIGKGGIATVYKAYHPPTDREVAIKVLSSDVASDPTFRQRFDREAKVLANLQHIHILPVFDYGYQDDVAYLVMPLITRGALSDYIRQQPQMPIDAVIRLFRQMASALDYAHQRGLLHRDIKPSNVLMDDSDNTLLADFGLARMVIGEHTANLTQSMIVGTPAYMSPEQGQGLVLDSRSDLYSMGVMLYEMLIGQVPYTAETPIAVIFRHISDPLPPIGENRPDLNPAVEAVLQRAMAKNPIDRYPTATAIADAFEAAVQGDAPVIVAPAHKISTVTEAATNISARAADEAPTFIGGAAPAIQPAPTHPTPDEATVLLGSKAQTTQVSRRSFNRDSWFWGVALISVVLIAFGALLYNRPGNNADSAGDASDVEAAFLLRQIDAHSDGALSVAFSPDGSRLITGGRDNLARVWDTATGEQLYLLEAHSGDVLSVAYSPQGDTLLTGGSDAMSYLWDAESGTQSVTNLAGSPVLVMVYSASGEVQAYIANQYLTIGGAQEHNLVHPDGIFFTALAFSPDESIVATGDKQGVIHLWDTRDGRLIDTLQEAEIAITDLAYSPDGESLAVAYEAGAIHIWNVSERTFTTLDAQTEKVNTLAYHPDGSQFATAGSDGVIRLWNPADDSLIATIGAGGHQGAIVDVAYRLDGRQIASAGEDGTVRLWDVVAAASGE